MDSKPIKFAGTLGGSLDTIGYTVFDSPEAEAMYRALNKLEELEEALNKLKED